MKKDLETITRNFISDKGFPRAVFASDLKNIGLETKEDQIEFAKYLISNPKNTLGRVMILLRENRDDWDSPAIQVARGPGNNLPESYISPHVENKACEYEKLSTIEGKGSVIIFNDEGNLIKAIPVTKEGVEIKPGVIHTVIYESPVAILFEEKRVPPGLPKTFLPWAIPENDPRVPEFLEKLHEFAG